VDDRVLRRCRPPVLDVGCGPARHTLALAHRGVPALGLDITSAMLDVARPTGATVLQRDVFERVPATGRWGTVLLLDGNVGIGGAPGPLLRRVHELLRPGGLVLLELTASLLPGERHDARVEIGGRTGPWFGWATVGLTQLTATVADIDGLTIDERWTDEGRLFASLCRVDGVSGA
jgi:SAM-dependent methyltransferase